MILAQLNLQNFRSYRKESFAFSSGLTLVVGPNTAGKTNIIEAIYMLATAKSFRADQDREVVRWGSEVSVVRCQFADGYEQTKLEMYITQGGVQGRNVPIKKYVVNGVARRQLDFVGHLHAVLFWPEHLELVTDSPSLRRKYLDSVLAQVDREYRRNLSSYERGIRQRNRLLDLIREGNATRSQLLFWDQLLIRTGGYLTDRREQFVDFVNRFPSPIMKYRLRYDKSVISETRLAQYKEEEVAAKSTLVGPHRDDIVFLTSSVQRPKSNVEEIILDLSKYGSRGEQRLAVLWLKLAELAFVEASVGDRPILLLDDVFSELDHGHRKFVLELIGKQQTVVTSSEKHLVDMFPAAVRKDFGMIRLPLVQ